MDDSPRSLSHLWKRPGFRPNRLLFLTYSFSFREFHNNILPELIENARGVPVEVDVIASALEDTRQSDCFHLKHLMNKSHQLRVHFTDSSPKLHTKAIVAIDSSNKSKLVGIGSANLTVSGWRDNLEIWNWKKRELQADVLHTLGVLAIRNSLDPLVLERWKSLLSVGTKRVSSGLVLKSGANTFDTCLSEMRECATTIDRASIVSPYFGSNSIELLARLLTAFPGLKALDIWIDASGRHSSAPHIEAAQSLLAHANKMRGKGFARVLAPYEEQRSPDGRASRLLPKPLHAKLVEVSNNRFASARIYGSSNFTPAGWGLDSTFNYELNWIESKCPKMTPAWDQVVQNAGYVGKDITSQLGRMKRLAEPETTEPGTGPGILWAVLDETSTPVEVRIKVERNQRDSVLDPRIHASYDPSRPAPEVAILMKIATSVSDKKNWNWQPPSSTGVLVARWALPRFIASETMWVSAVVNGRRIEAPLIVIPNIEERSESSGIPLSETAFDIASILGGTPDGIVSDRSNKYENQSGDEETDTEVTIDAGDSFDFSSPEYSHDPDVVKLLRRIRKLQLLGADEQLSSLVSRLRRVQKYGNSASRLVAGAVLRSMSSHG